MDAATLSRERDELGMILGLPEPVSAEVLTAALADEAYARNLLLCRRDPELLEHLLANPPRRRAEFGRAELAGRAAKALARWARTGFTFVEEETRLRRLAACEACPELLGGDGAATCGLCGCRVELKARLSSESCPGADPDAPRLTRWREPLTQKKNTTMEAAK